MKRLPGEVVRQHCILRRAVRKPGQGPYFSNVHICRVEPYARIGIHLFGALIIKYYGAAKIFQQKRILILLFLKVAICGELFAIHDNLNGKFIFPLPTRVRVSGSFAELRSSHIHRGVDVRTMGLMGIPVMAVADGHVSVLHASNLYRGFGQAVYLSHPEGMGSTYGHLFAYSQKHNLQAAFELYTQMTEGQYFYVYQPPGKYPVKQGDVVAYTGDKGSGTAHLHYEITDEDKNHYNPVSRNLLHVNDPQKPGFSRLQLLLHDRTIKGKRLFQCKPQKISALEYLCKNPLPADGKISFKVTVWDNMNAPNNTGVSRIKLTLSGRTLYRTDTNAFPRENSAEHRKLFDAYGAGRGYTYKLFWPQNEHREPPFFVREHADRGYTDVSQLQDTNYLPGKIEISDAQENSTVLHFNILKSPGKPLSPGKPIFNIGRGKSKKYTFGRHKVQLPVQKNRTFFKVSTKKPIKTPAHLNILSKAVKVNYYSEGKRNVPVIHFQSAFRRSLGIYTISGKLISRKYNAKTGSYVAKGSGAFILAQDISRPKISLESSYGPMDKLYLALPVSDSGSGIDENGFSVRIDGNTLDSHGIKSWKIRYDKERKSLLIPTGYFPDKKALIGGSIHFIQVTASDMAGNKSPPFEGYIYLKNLPGD